MPEVKTIARNISLIESRAKGYEKILLQLKQPKHEPPIIGITGAPGAGKSTIVDGLIEQIVNDNKKVAVLCVDPSSPFNMGALLGDRIRMSKWYTHPLVFIRSLANHDSRSEEHTSELQSRIDLVCRLLLEKKKKTKNLLLLAT